MTYLAISLAYIYYNMQVGPWMRISIKVISKAASLTVLRTSVAPRSASWLLPGRRAQAPRRGPRPTCKHCGGRVSGDLGGEGPWR